MPGEELIQRGYMKGNYIRGEIFGIYERLNLGNTSARELLRSGFLKSIPERIDFPFQYYKPPKKPESAKPDSIFFRRSNSNYTILAALEIKQPIQFNTKAQQIKAVEQALFAGFALGSRIGIATDGNRYLYLDIVKSISKSKIKFIDENRDLNPAVLEGLLSEESAQPKNLNPLAEKVWQAIWHATKEEPKQCLMTFVEIFILKFLSDNLPEKTLPKRYSFYELIAYDEKNFLENYGKTQIEYYVQEIRNHIKSIFPDKTVLNKSEVCGLFGLKTIVSPTSVINGFAFLQSGSTSIQTFNRTFLEILGYFNEFGPLQKIDPEFKLRLYETFLKKTVRQQKLGQFFTPRNIVRAMIKMAELNDLPEGAIVFDPAAGVGGFILEPLIELNALQGNVTFKNGMPVCKIRLVGADCDINTNILAKSNTLIHLAEFLHDPTVSLGGLNVFMTETFLVLNTNQHLGSLEYPIKEQIDVILTNPPYVTQGSRIYKEEITNLRGMRNGLDLREYYSRCGLGLESLFLRYISGSLKPGGRAFVIVPQGFLTRTETTTKEQILSECNILASISLPRNSFYSTAQKTYIIALEKRRTSKDKRPPIFCAISTSVGESLDARRIPTPNDYDLFEIADAFLLYFHGKKNIPAHIKNKIRFIDPSNFSSSDRWDIYRFWSDEELVQLGERDEAIPRSDFLDEIQVRFKELSEDLLNVKRELQKLQSGPVKQASVSDESIFKVRRGRRVTRKDGDENPGNIPVYSGSKDPRRPLCSVSESWAKKQNIPIESKPIITINANGYVGAVFHRNEKCIIHDDVMIIEIQNDVLDMQYASYALRSAIAEGNYEYEAKLYNRVKELTIAVPILPDGHFDVQRQKKIATTFKKFDTLKESVSELGIRSQDARIKG